MIVFIILFPVITQFTETEAPMLMPAGTHVGDTVVGGMTPSEAHDAIQSRVDVLTIQNVQFSLGDDTLMPRLFELGIAYDVDASLEGLSESGSSNMVPMVIRFDPAVFDAWIDARLAELGGGAINAAVIINDVKDISVTPSSPGMVLDREAVQAALVDQASTLQPVSLTAQVSLEDAPIRNAIAKETQKSVQQALAQPWVLSVGDAKWDIDPEDIAPALRIVPMQHSLELSWDAVALDNILDGIASDMDTESSDSWVQDLGTKSWLVPATEGRTVDRAAAVVSLQQALTNGDHEVELPVHIQNAPAVATQDVKAELGITSVVGEGDSIYSGSGYGRMNNVEIAAYMIDGTLVPPGEVFSFNAAVGSLFDGQYMDAGSYIDGPSGQSLAGGVCQVSTTVFRAALDAGFPIVEWWPHSYRSPFYELGGWSPGYDAAIVQDGGNPAESTDFRFRNPTDSWLMISAKVSDDGELKVSIEGADPGYRVVVSEPIVETTEWATSEVSVVVDDQLPQGTDLEQPAMNGLRVTVYRSVYDANGNLISEDSFVSSYGANGGIRRLSPDMVESAIAR